MIRAASINRYGELESIEWKRYVEPKTREGELKIMAKAWGVSHADVVLLRGFYYLKPEPPIIAGMEVAGTVIEVGAGVSKDWIGRDVAAYVESGGWAEQVIAKREGVYCMPPGMPLTVACWFPVVYGTAWLAVRERGEVQAGESILVVGASGVVGTAVMDIAKEMGVKVIAVASNEVSRTLLEKRWKCDAVNYDTEGWEDTVRGLTKGIGVDVVIDMVGGEIVKSYMKTLRQNGRVVAVGFASGRVQRYKAAQLVMGELSIIGSSWTGLWRRKPKYVRCIVEQLKEKYEHRRIAPLVGEIMGQMEIARAIENISERRTKGKVVLVKEGIRENWGERI